MLRRITISPSARLTTTVFNVELWLLTPIWQWYVGIWYRKCVELVETPSVTLSQKLNAKLLQLCLGGIMKWSQTSLRYRFQFLSILFTLVSQSSSVALVKRNAIRRENFQFPNKREAASMVSKISLHRKVSRYCLCINLSLIRWEGLPNFLQSPWWCILRQVPKGLKLLAILSSIIYSRYVVVFLWSAARSIVNI